MYFENRKDEYKIAIEKYDQTILRAMQETNDALYTLKMTDGKRMISQDRLDLSDKEYSLIQTKEKIGMADDLDLLMKKQAVSNRINSLVAMIGLYQALGGVDYTEAL